MNEKYELTEEFKEIETLREGWLQKIKVYRIRALRAFADVKIGDLGGFVETKQNLSNMGNAEVCGDAKIFFGVRVLVPDMPLRQCSEIRITVLP